MLILSTVGQVTANVYCVEVWCYLLQSTWRELSMLIMTQLYEDYAALENRAWILREPCAIWGDGAFPLRKLPPVKLAALNKLYASEPFRDLLSQSNYEVIGTPYKWSHIVRPYLNISDQQVAILCLWGVLGFWTATNLRIPLTSK